MLEEDLADQLAPAPDAGLVEDRLEQQALASAGIEAVLAGPANALARAFDFSAHRRLLDVGGGTGSWAIAAACAYPHLEAGVFELPTVAEVAGFRGLFVFSGAMDLVAAAMVGALVLGRTPSFALHHHAGAALVRLRLRR